MFNEKRLLKHIEREEKSGIILMFDDFAFTMIADGWMAETLRENLMNRYREVLGHIVEVLGYIPETECVRIRRGKGEWIVEHPIPEVITESVCAYRMFGSDEPLQYTGLHYGGALWQTADGIIRRRTVDGPSPGGKPRLTDREILVLTDVSGGEAAWYTTYRPREDISPEREIELWRHLESVFWTDWEAANNAAQMELEE